MAQLKSFQFVITFVLVLKKIESEDKTKYDTFYSNAKEEIVINESDIDGVFQSIHITVISVIQKSLGKGSGWIIDSIIGHTISISKYNPLPGSSYEITKRIRPSKKILINIQDVDDNKFFKWCLVRYVNPADHHQQELQKLKKILPKSVILKT